MKKIILFVFAFLLCAVQADAFVAKGFNHPYGVVVDPATGFIYVSCMNGPGEKKDDNGSIARIKPDGTVDLYKFIDGIQSLVDLNAPKGMAIIGSFLYVADIDAVRVFQVSSGKKLFAVNFGDYPVKHFYDLAIGPDGALYVTEGPSNTIYRIDVMKQHSVTPFIKDEVLGEPHGIAWFSNKQVFLVGGWHSGQVLAFDRSGKRVSFPLVSVKALEGLATDTRGNAYLTGTALNAAYRMDVNGALFPYVDGIDSPIGIADHAKNKEVLIVSYRRNALISYPAPK